MKFLLWEFNIKKRPKPVSEEYVNLVSAVGQIQEALVEWEKRLATLETTANRIERKVYRAEGKELPPRGEGEEERTITAPIFQAGESIPAEFIEKILGGK